MDQALQNYRGANQATTTRDTQAPAYRSADPRNPQPGPAARAEQNIKEGAHDAGAAVKRGAQRTGEAIKHGAQRTGEAVGNGMERSGAAIRRGGEKLKDKRGCSPARCITRAIHHPTDKRPAGLPAAGRCSCSARPYSARLMDHPSPGEDPCSSHPALPPRA
jgi:hypothetical protein